MARPKKNDKISVPKPSSEAARRRMEAARQRDTAAELEVRSLLHRAGLRFRVDTAPVKGLRRRGDIVFRRQRVVVFVDGCFWHGCPRHGTWPKANAAFWRDKIEANRRRDLDTDRQLRLAGWSVIRIWEHEDPPKAARRVVQTLQASGPLERNCRE